MAGGNAAADEDDAIEASDDEGFVGVPAMPPAAAFKRPAPITPRQMSVSVAWSGVRWNMHVILLVRRSATSQAVAVRTLMSCCRLQPPRRKAKTSSNAKPSSKAKPGSKATQQEARTKTIASFFQSASALGEGRALTHAAVALRGTCHGAVLHC